MGIGKLTRAAGKIGLAVEGLTYLWQAGSALFAAIRGKSSQQPTSEIEQPTADAGQHGAADQDSLDPS